MTQKPAYLFGAIPKLDGKVCARCKMLLPFECFKREPKLRDGLFSWCRQCSAAATKRWRDENPEQIAASNAARRTGNRTVECRCCGVEFERKAAAVYCSKACRLMYARGRYRAKRWAAMRASDVTAADVRAILRGRTFCPLCRKKLSDVTGHPHQRHLDHIVPVSQGGTHERSNLRVLCATCNLRRPRDGRDVLEAVA